MKIVIRATNWLGDAIISLPAVRAVRHNHPDSEITVLARRSLSELYAREAVVDHVIPYDGRRWVTARLLREKRFDLGILLPNSFDSALLFQLGRVRRIVGYNQDFRRLLLSNPIDIPKTVGVIHQRFYYLQLLQSAGFVNCLQDVEQPVRLDRAQEAATAGREAFDRLNLNSPVVGVSPGAAFGGAKRWLPERFAESAAFLAAQLGGSIAIFGAPDDLETCASVERLIRRVPTLNLAGKTSLREFIDLAAACSLFLTNDSGSMHLASALGVPTVAIFGATDADATGPCGPYNAIVREPVPCSPCLRRECPIDHRCMTRVTTDRVQRAAAALIQL